MFGISAVARVADQCLRQPSTGNSDMKQAFTTTFKSQIIWILQIVATASKFTEMQEMMQGERCLGELWPFPSLGPERKNISLARVTGLRNSNFPLGKSLHPIKILLSGPRELQGSDGASSLFARLPCLPKHKYF